jgi:hypothetical protein
MKLLFKLAFFLALLCVAFAGGWVTAKIGVGSVVDEASLSDLERQFTARLRNAALVGRFTVAGREDREASPDRYDIASVEKVGDNQWRFNARLPNYKTATLPIVVTMEWAGDTPMITMTDVTIPTLGTFTARVFFYGDRYAGTWQHGKFGGHMFGRIEPNAADGRAPVEKPE